MTEPSSQGNATGFEPPQDVEKAPDWLERILDWAYARRATDLHFFPAEEESMLWIRTDGVLREIARYSTPMHERLIARLKVMGACPDYTGDPVQEGRFTLNGKAASGEARLSILPTLHGEKAVVRLMAGAGELRRLADLGFGETLIARLRQTLDRPQGLLLAVGPSGCGKTTALYALMQDLHERAGGPVSSFTIEDPVEQALPLTAQMTVEPARGFGFAEGLRALLRQDPEVIMIGEIRDAATSRTALQAALTGHRLMSSMHTLTAGEALIRLMQMGCAPYEISSAIAGILNLRLVRLLCPHCRSIRDLGPREVGWLADDEDAGLREVSEASGCDACLSSGHLGRTAIGEWLELTSETIAALQSQAPAGKIAETLKLVVSARDSSLRLIREGTVSLDEIVGISGLASFASSNPPGK